MKDSPEPKDKEQTGFKEKARAYLGDLHPRNIVTDIRDGVKNSLQSVTPGKAIAFGVYYTLFPISFLLMPPIKNSLFDTVKTSVALAAAVMALNQGVQQVSGIVFDDIDNYLKEQGYSAEILREYEGENIRLRNRDNFGFWHTFHDMPPALSAVFNQDRFLDEAEAVHGGSMLSLMFSQKTLKPLKYFAGDYLQHFITLPDENTTALDIVNSHTRLNETDIDLHGLTTDLLYKAEVLYALRMSDGEKELLVEGIPDEAEARIYAYKTLADLYDNPELLKAGLYMSAMDLDIFNFTDVALYFDTYLNGTPLPDRLEEREIDDAFEDILPENFSTEGTVDIAVSAFRAALENQGDEFSPAVKSRLTLYLEAASYFAPQLYPAGPFVQASPASHTSAAAPG